MNSHEFSVLISLYNKEKECNLIECLNSIVSQTIQASEVVIVFDGFIKESLVDVVASYQNKLPIKVIKLESNLGLGKALNYGLINCSNSLVARMDTDDICLPERFELQLNEFIKRPKLDMIGTSIIEFDKNFNEREKKLPVEFSDIKKFSKYKNPFNHMTVMFNKDAVIDAGGYKHHLYMEDYNLWLRMIHNNKYIRNMTEVTVMARTDDMYDRRRGLKYLKSELELFALKNELKVLSLPESLFILLLRSIIRVLPGKIISFIYKVKR